MGPTWECCLGVVVVVVVQYPGVQVYNNYPFKSSEKPVSFALTATNTQPSTLPVIRTIRVCLRHFVLTFLFQMVSTCLQRGHIGFHWYNRPIVTYRPDQGNQLCTLEKRAKLVGYQLQTSFLPSAL